jgi:two-component system chemotaxis response regulator CheY
MAYDFSRVNILVVESTHEMFKLFKSVMVMLDVPEKNIYSAFSAEEGFERFCHEKHDMIITDWLQSPDKGVELTVKVRSDFRSPNRFAPVIMTAGSGHKNRVLKARDAGISEYLVKPFSANALATRITRVIERPRPFVLSERYTGPDRRIKEMPVNIPERRKEKLQIERE